MRIALYHNLLAGGAKRSLYESTRRLALHHHIDVFTLKCADHNFADLRPFVAGHRVFDFRPLRLFSFPFGRLNQAIRLVELLRLSVLSRVMAREMEQGDYDVALIHPCQFTQSPQILNYLPGTPKVYYCHESLRLLYETMPLRPYEFRADVWRRRLLDGLDPLPLVYRAALKRTDLRSVRYAQRVLVNSHFMQDVVRRIYGIEPQVSYHGVDTEKFRPIAVEKQQFVLSVGALTPLKGFDFLIEAVACIPASHRPVLVIASNSQLKNERIYLEQLAHSLDVKLRLLVNISDEQLVQLYSQALMTLYAPIREPFGMVPLESMACGTPVVAVREGGIQETVVHEQTGFLSARDPAQFADWVQNLLSNPERAIGYGRKGREHVVTHWNWDKSVSSLQENLEDIVGRSHVC